MQSSQQQQQQQSAASVAGGGVAVKNRVSILDKPLIRPKTEINLSTFALLMSEMVLYCNKRSANINEFQTKFADFGRFIGVRLLDLIYFREKKDKRETKHLDQLQFIKKNVWKSIYGKEADSVERNTTDPTIYYIIEKDPIVNKFLPSDKLDYNCGYLNVGIIDAILNESNFPCKVNLTNYEGSTYYQVTFDKSVIAREKQ